jgi:hypothetical protein
MRLILNNEIRTRVTVILIYCARMMPQPASQQESDLLFKGENALPVVFHADDIPAAFVGLVE